MASNISFKSQQEMQQKVEKLYSIINLNLKSKSYNNFVILDKEGHTDFCSDGLISLPRGVSSLSSGQPWLIYWILNALDLLGYEVPQDLKAEIVNFIAQCKCPKTRAFCGGPYQIAHLAPTYASLCALISVNTDEGYSIIDRRGVYEFILSMKRTDAPGAFKMHENGESDMRSTYCAICVASLLNIIDENLTKDVTSRILSCQSYDGGFAAEPFGESHGGYTYCAVASLIMLGQLHLCNCDAVLEWCLSRQMEHEGGFNGRPNKIVDSCYSFWIGATIVMLKEKLGINVDSELFDAQALQAYILIASQSPMGFFDKPGSAPDYYHTAYSLSGLSLSQTPSLFKEYSLELPIIDPLVNAIKIKTNNARNYFLSQGSLN